MMIRRRRLRWKQCVVAMLAVLVVVILVAQLLQKRPIPSAVPVQEAPIVQHHNITVAIGIAKHERTPFPTSQGVKKNEVLDKKKTNNFYNNLLELQTTSMPLHQASERQQAVKSDPHSSHLVMLPAQTWEVGARNGLALLDQHLLEQQLNNSDNTSSNSDNKVLQALAKATCLPPTRIEPQCCWGSYAGHGVLNTDARHHCRHVFSTSKNSPYERLQRSVGHLLSTKSMTQTLQSVRCDACQIVQLLHQFNLSLALTGDSMQTQVWWGLVCELQRRHYHVQVNWNWNWPPWAAPNGGELYHSIPYRMTLKVQLETSWNRHDNTANEGNVSSPITMYYFPLYMLPFQFPQERDEVLNAAEVLMLGFGLHYEPQQANGDASRSPRAYTNALTELFEYISNSTTRTQLLLHRETSAQHFAAPGGSYAAWAHTPEFFANKECQPLRQAANSTSGTRWREDCVRQAARSAGRRIVVMNGKNAATNNNHHVPELVVLPFYEFTAAHYDMHPKFDRQSVDCTHFCTTPDLYLPLWRSLRLALERHVDVRDGQ